MLRHRKTSQRSYWKKKTFLIGLLYFGEQEDVRMFFFNLVLLMRFLSILSFSLVRKNTWKGFFKLLDFPKTILPPLFQVSSFGKCWSESGLPDRPFARSSRFADWCSKKTLKQNQSWNIQLFSVHANVQPCLLQLHAGCPFSWQVIDFLFKTTFTAIIAHWALINDLHPFPLSSYPILTEYLILRHLAVTRPLSSSSTWMIPDICHFFTWDIFVAFWTPESFFGQISAAPPGSLRLLPGLLHSFPPFLVFSFFRFASVKSRCLYIWGRV